MVTYDKQEDIAAYAKRAGITFPLLSDPKSEAIRAFGVLSEEVQEASSWYGYADPSAFVIDRTGKVTQGFSALEHRYDSNPETILSVLR